MFTSIKSDGIGPHAALDLALSPTGRTVIRGRSEHGKSVLIDAILLALFGVTRGGEPFAVEQMSADKLAITLTSASGREFGYTRKRKGSPKWSYTNKGDTVTADSIKEWTAGHVRERLPLWTGGDARRDGIAICFEPLAWTAYAVSSPTVSRRLRDLLVCTGPSAEDAARELYTAAGHTWTSEVYDEKRAASLVTEANRAFGAAGGALDQARASLAAAVPPEAPDTSAADGLPGLVAAEGLWAAYDRARTDHDRQVSGRMDARATHDRGVAEMAATLARLDQRDADALAAAEATHRRAVAEWEAGRLNRDARHAAEVDQAAVEYRAAVEARAERMALALSNVQRWHAEAVDAAEQDYQRDVLGHAERVAKMEAEHNANIERHAFDLAVEAADNVELMDWEGRRADQSATCETCGQSLPCADLGPAPVVRVAGPPPVAPTLPPEPTRRTVPAFVPPLPEREVVARTVAPLGPMRAAPVYVAPAPSYRPDPLVWTELDPLAEPSAPTVERPSADALRAARDAVAARDRYTGALEMHARSVARLEAAVGEAVRASVAKMAEATKAAAWLAAVRAAPGEVARRLAWLGSIGDGITVELPETGPAVVIRIDGRPWRMASRGRLICADAHLRRAFSAALGVPTLPIVIDDRQSWTGPIDIAGPVIELVTDPTAERITSAV
jgi:hypothetical protein